MCKTTGSANSWWKIKSKQQWRGRTTIVGKIVFVHFWAQQNDWNSLNSFWQCELSLSMANLQWWLTEVRVMSRLRCWRNSVGEGLHPLNCLDSNHTMFPPVRLCTPKTVSLNLLNNQTLSELLYWCVFCLTNSNNNNSCCFLMLGGGKFSIIRVSPVLITSESLVSSVVSLTGKMLWVWMMPGPTETHLCRICMLPVFLCVSSGCSYILLQFTHAGEVNWKF